MGRELKVIVGARVDLVNASLELDAAEDEVARETEPTGRICSICERVVKLAKGF